MRSHLVTRILATAALSLPIIVVPTAASAAPTADTPALGSVIPVPAQVTPDSTANFTLSPLTVIVTQPGSAAAYAIGRQLARDLRPATGYPLVVLPFDPVIVPTVELRLGATDPALGDGGYRLTVARNSVTIRANKAAGLFAGTQTLRQLLPAAIDATSVQRRKWTIAGGSIVDYPRYAYRGAMLDEARHFHTPGEIKSYIDDISRFKINYLHLHLADDQGWRIQIDSWPRLTTVGGAAGTGVDGVGGGYLTKAQYKDLVKYAAARYVTIVPEIDMPGHVNAAQVAYPELTCDGVAPQPRTDTDVGYSSLCIDKDVTYRFIDDVIRELAAMTPGPYIHIGGDEAQATSDPDYITFEQKVLPIVAKYGKTPYGWNEITKAGPAASSAVAQFWGTGTSNPSLVSAAAAGTKVVMSPANKAYIDQKYDENTVLGLDWAGYIEVQTAYDWNPATRVRNLPASAVIGVEAPLWSETLRSLDDIEFLAFPRLPAIAELGWSPAATHDWASFRARLGAYGPRWVFQGVDFYRSPQVDWS